MKRLHLAATIFALTVMAAGCGGGHDAAGTVRLLTHASFLASDDVLAEFTATTGYEIEIIQGADAGSVVNQAILTAGNPVADVLYGVDTTFLSRALDADLFSAYRSPAADGLPPDLILDDRHLVTPITFGDVCVNYDKAAFGDVVAVPQSLRDLTDPAYRDMFVVQNPATSSPGLAFMLATIAVFGEESDGTPYPWLAYWKDLRDNGLEVAGGWEEAYYGSFSGGGSGDRPLVVSYASSPPAAVIFASEPLTEAPTGVITDGCFRQTEFAGVLRGASEKDGAEALIDFMLSKTFQEDVPLNMFVFPASPEATLPDAFIEHAIIPDTPAVLDPARIEANRERWIEEWTDAVLR